MHTKQPADEPVNVWSLISVKIQLVWKLFMRAVRIAMGALKYFMGAVRIVMGALNFYEGGQNCNGPGVLNFHEGGQNFNGGAQFL